MTSIASAQAPSTELAVSLLIPAKSSAEVIERTATEAYRFLSARYPGRFEIILIPNRRANETADRTEDVARELAGRFPEIRVCLHTEPAGKGAALRTGVRASRGAWIFFTDADLPYDLEFLDRAAMKLRTGYDLVTGNRRLPESHFEVPVEWLRLAYKRHRLGLLFNRVVRLFLPIETSDTQAGIKAMSRRLALRAFELQKCPGFFFDLEIFLAASGGGYAQTELPVTLYLNSEKSTVRVLKESFLAVYWLARIVLRQWAGAYGRRPKPRVLPLYGTMDFGTRLFLWARWHLTPYWEMASRLPPAGAILDLGCGHGLLALALAQSAADREVYGVDHDAKRIELASIAAKPVSNIRFEKGSMLDPQAGDQTASRRYRGIAMIDVMHYFKPETQERLAREAFRLLESGGTLIVREVDPDGGAVSAWNRLYEKIATGIGFTQADQQGLHFRSRHGWEEMLRSAGFEVSSERCSSFLFADILYICQRTSE